MGREVQDGDRGVTEGQAKQAAESLRRKLGAPWQVEVWARRFGRHWRLLVALNPFGSPVDVPRRHREIEVSRTYWQRSEVEAT
jgi:hypothetical protein